MTPQPRQGEGPLIGTAGRPFTDDRVRHVCLCGWEGDWAEAFGHVCSYLEGEHRIVRDYLPERP